MEIALLPMAEETSRLLTSFREVRCRMEKAATHDEMTEALCLLPSARRAFDSSMQSLRTRLAELPQPGELILAVPEPLEFPAIDNARRVPMYVAGWFCGVVALALMTSFALGFITARGGP